MSRLLKRVGNIALVVALLICLTISGEAHPYYTWDNGYTELEWAVYSGGKCYLAINYQYLSDEHEQYGVHALCWEDACPDEITVESVNLYQSNVDFATATEDAWIAMVGLAQAYSVRGMTQLRTTDGVSLHEIASDRAAIEATSCQVDYAQIIISSIFDFSGASDIKKTIAHETGHVLGLGHATGSTVSIMRSGSVSYVTPQQHDKDDIAAKYSGGSI